MSRPIKESLERLYGLLPGGRKFGLERVQAACDKLGNPEKSFKTVHVAGTNGKGSVCAFVASMLVADGKKVGLFTSPHLTHFAERIQINGELIDDDTLSDLIQEVMNLQLELTFFETATILGFLAFARAGVEIAVVEVGLGGRLDSTNVLPPPEIVAITRVSFDHMDMLGTSLSEIAVEKAAIIKRGSRVVVGKLHPDATEAVKARCAEVGAELLELGSPEPYERAKLTYPRMAMYGSNLAVAVTIARALNVSQEAMVDGIQRAQWPGRNELLHRSNQELTLLDCAHNPDAAVCLSHVIDSALNSGVGTRANVALVFGAIEGKNWKSMLDRLEGCTSHRFYVKAPVAKSVEPNRMVGHLRGIAMNDIPTAVQQAREKVGQQGLVVVTGSVYVVGAARAFLLNLTSDPVAEA